MAVPVPVRIVGGGASIGSTVEVTQTTGSDLHTVVDSGTISTITNVVHVDDNSSTLSVDDGGGNISVDDGGGSVTVDNAGTFAVQAAQSGSWTVTINADALTYNPVGSETGLVVRPLPNREQLTLERLLLVLIEETRQSRRAFLDWVGTSDPRQIYSDNVNLVQ